MGMAKKMKRRILVPGLGVAKAMGFGCTCNLSYGELIVNPSTLLWADKLCVVEDFISMLGKDEGSNEEYVLKSMFDMLGEQGLVEIVDSNMLDNAGRRLKCLNEIVANEISDLNIADPKAISFDKEGHMFSVKGRQYCMPVLVAGYASQLFARDINASCLLDRNFDKYLRLRRDVLSENQICNPHDSVYDEVFSVVIPNDLSFPLLVDSRNKMCPRCAHLERCSREFKDNVNGVVQKIIQVRNQDAFCLLRQEVDNAIDDCSNGTGIFSVEDVKAKLRERALKIYKLEQREFPRLKRWTNLAMMVSSSTTYLGVQSGSAVLTAVGGAGIAAAKLLDGYIGYKANKNRWVDYLNKRTTPIMKC